MTTASDLRRTLVRAAFRMPSVQTMMSRKSSITNAFVNAIIPVVPPTHEEIEKALSILEMECENVRCAYCGDVSTEWDHLRPLVLNRRPTGFISEIANLVPACGKCNQSKGNKDWSEWIVSNARLSPTGRRIAGVQRRIELLHNYVQWRSPTRVNFEAILSKETWEEYWSLCEGVVEELRRSQAFADSVRQRISDAVKTSQ